MEEDPLFEPLPPRAWLRPEVFNAMSESELRNVRAGDLILEFIGEGEGMYDSAQLDRFHAIWKEGRFPLGEYHCPVCDAYITWLTAKKFGKCEACRNGIGSLRREYPPPYSYSSVDPRMRD